MEYKILTSSSPEELTRKVNNYINEEGWKPVGSHIVIQYHAQNRYAGSQHMDTHYKHEYSQTMIKETE